MSSENKSWLDCLEINQALVLQGIEFATPRYRCLYGGTSRRDRPQWLKDHPGVWRRIEDVLREAASWCCAEIPAEAAAAGPSSQVPSDIPKDSKDADGAAFAAVPEGDPLPPDPPALTMEGSKAVPSPCASDFEDEITIDGQRYVSADRLASMRDISRRKLSRQIAAGKVPPMIKIGKKLYFEVGRISEGPATDASERARPT